MSRDEPNHPPDPDPAELAAAFAPRFDFEGELVYGAMLYGPPGPPFAVDLPPIHTDFADGEHSAIHTEGEA
jgi:hypothetical protein